MNRFAIHHIASTTSTNDEVRRLLDQGADDVVVMADFQEAGRGQRGHHWESADGLNLLFSIGLRPTFLRADEQYQLLQAASLAVAEEAEAAIGAPVCIKWPNDVYCGDCKLSGTLIEIRLEGACLASAVIGIGLNVNQTAFLSDAPNPTSLSRLASRLFDRATLLDGILTRFADYYAELRRGASAALMDAYVARLYRREGLHAYRDGEGEFRAAFSHIEPSGHLWLRRDDGRLSRYAFKEVQFLI